jgi:hypothetical protein
VKQTLLLSTLAAACAVALVPALASAYNAHLCGPYGTWVSPQDSCPGLSPRHSWKRVTAYRNQSGIDMCVVIRNQSNRYLFSRCSHRVTSIYVPPRDMNYGRSLTRAYNKNNNVAYGREKRYLYADTR